MRSEERGMRNEEIISRLIENNITIATAESCTGGSLGKIITSFSGVSAIYGFGFITYANEAKEKILGVSHETLEKHGAVSSECAREMAIGARKVAKSDIAVSVTGIAGPTGGTKEKPVGLVYIAFADKNGVEVRKLNLSGTRDEIRAKTCDEVFKLISEQLSIAHSS